MFLISIPCDKIFQFVLNLLTLKFYKSIKIGYNFYIIDTRASILPCSFLVTRQPYICPCDHVHHYNLPLSGAFVYHKSWLVFFCFNATKIIGTTSCCIQNYLISDFRKPMERKKYNISWNCDFEKQKNYYTRSQLYLNGSGIM